MMMIIMMIMLVHARSMSDDGYDVDDDERSPEGENPPQNRKRDIIICGTKLQ